MVVGLAGSVDGLPAAGRAWLGRWTPVCNTWLTCPVLVTYPATTQTWAVLEQTIPAQQGREPVPHRA